MGTCGEHGVLTSVVHRAVIMGDLRNALLRAASKLVGERVPHRFNLRRG